MANKKRIKRMSVYQGLAKYFEKTALELLSSQERKHLIGKGLGLSIAVIKRHMKSQIRAFPYSVKKTGAFIVQEGAIQDPIVRTKLGELIDCLQIGDKRLNNPNLNKRERFVTHNNQGFFDKSGRFIADFMADSMHIRHFHVGYNKLTNDQLVYALFHTHEITLLAIGCHSDMYIESKENPIFNVLETELPVVADSLCPVMKGILPSFTDQPSPQDIKNLKTNGVNIHFADSQGQARMVLNGNTMARTPIDTRMFADRIAYELRDIVQDENATFISLEHHKGHPCLLLKLPHGHDYRYELVKLNTQSALVSAAEMLEELFIVEGVGQSPQYPRIQERFKSKKNQKRIART
nr:hypothetical protein [uncultured Pseudodesulfovibrio sp.]